MTIQDTIFNHICRISDVLENENIPYVLSEGTLLGAVRDSDIIRHEDRDFEFEVNSIYTKNLLALNKTIQSSGYEIVNRSPGTYPFDVGYHLDDMKKERDPVGGAAMYIRFEGKTVGDISLYTIFDDGFARRYCLETEAYPLPRMTLPAWFFEGGHKVKIRNRAFPAPRHPETVLEKIYGPEWLAPKKPGEFAKGYHPRSGHCYDADPFPLLDLALKNGWDTDYSGNPAWPRPVRYVGSYAGRTWLQNYEPALGFWDDELFSEDNRKFYLDLLESEPSEAQRAKIVHCLVSKRHQLLIDSVRNIKTTADDLESQKAYLSQYFEDFQKELDEIRQNDQKFRENSLVKFAVFINKIAKRNQ